MSLNSSRRAAAAARRAARLFRGEATVKTRLLHLYAKLRASDRATDAGAFNRGPLTPGVQDRLAP